MERIRALITKLQEQSENNAHVSAMMATVQMLQAEMAQVMATAPRQMSTTKVAVVLPSANNINYQIKEAPEPVAETKKLPESKMDFISSGKNANNKIDIRKDIPKEKAGWLDTAHEIPTLVHQKEFVEMNDMFGSTGSSSLNDTLKSEKAELASVLTEGPLRDLKKAIGVNDRFVFLSELFRGDEPMYERSIKTINNFRIYPEAEYWIERELKTKLGWDENKEAVKQFRQLVKRRFM